MTAKRIFRVTERKTTESIAEMGEDFSAIQLRQMGRDSASGRRRISIVAWSGL
jgi:hypothetical protein